MKTVNQKGTGLPDSRRRTSECARTTRSLWSSLPGPHPGPHPAPRCPVQQAVAPAAARLTRPQRTWRGWSGAGPGRTTELKSKCPRAVGLPRGEPSQDRKHQSSRKVAASLGPVTSAGVSRRSGDEARPPPAADWGLPWPLPLRAPPAPSLPKKWQRTQHSLLRPAPTPGRAQHRAPAPPSLCGRRAPQPGLGLRMPVAPPTPAGHQLRGPPTPSGS